MSGQSNPAFTFDEKKDTQSFTGAFTSKEDLIRDYGSVELGVLSKEESNEPEYDPFQHRLVSHPTTSSETLFHLLKGSLGTGILSMPLAFHHSGYLVGIIGTVVIGCILTYCIHMILNTMYYLCRKKKVPSFTFPALAEAAFNEGPPAFKACSGIMVHVVNAFLLIYQLGICCVYTVFIADNIKDVVDTYTDTKIPIKYYMLMILLPLILINYIQNLKILAPFSTVANFITLVTFGIILYYVLQKGITFEEKEPFGKIEDFPLFFGTVLFALEAIGVMLPLENEMKNPQHFGGTFGVLNIGMSSIVFLYVGMGLLGYLAYGAHTAATITLNIGDDITAKVAKILLSLAIYITHALQMYVAIDIVWNQYILYNMEKIKYQIVWEYVIRTALVLGTFALAVAVPRLELFISLFGALCLSALGLALPALMEISVTWYHIKGYNRWLLYSKDVFLIFFGVLGLIVGTSTSLKAIIDSFSESGEH